MDKPNRMTTGFHCDSCDFTARLPWLWKTVEVDARPQDIHRHLDLPYCSCGDEMNRVELCEECEQTGKFVPAYESLGFCLAHAQQFADKDDLPELIREIALLPSRMRS